MQRHAAIFLIPHQFGWCAAGPFDDL